MVPHGSWLFGNSETVYHEVYHEDDAVGRDGPMVFR